MDLNSAIRKHAEWKYKFRNANSTNETLDAAAISRDDNCELGKWLHGEAKGLYGTHSAYAQCVSAHATFHVEAGKVAAMVNSKMNDEVERMIGLGSVFTAASKTVAVALVELQNLQKKISA